MIEAKFNNVINEGRTVLICTIKNGTREELEKVARILKQHDNAVLACDDRYRFYNVEDSGIVLLKTDESIMEEIPGTIKKRHWWSRR